MPKASKRSASEHLELEGYEGHSEELDGGYTVFFETYSEDTDPEPFFKGLPDDRCQSPHWGYVVKGKLVFTTANGEEVFEAGDAYYIPPGHTPRWYAGTEVIEFSPTEELRRTIDVVSANMQAAP